MKLISEHFSNDVEYITEATEDGKKNYKLKGVFLQAEIKNRNGRVYPCLLYTSPSPRDS